MGTDRCAYLSRLRKVDPIPKVWFSLAALLICVLADSVLVGLFTLAALAALNVALGGQRFRDLLHFLKVPLVFLVIGCLTIALRPIGAAEALWAAELFGRWRWGITAANLRLGLQVFCKAMGAVSAMYFLSLNTPMTDLTMALERLHVPKLFVELAELIYRFIFLLAGEAARIRIAQDSRLGYQGFRRSVSSMGALLSSVFIRSLRRGDRVFSALESRGYTGALTTLPGQYAPGRWLYGAAAAIAACQLLILFAEGRLSF